MAEEATQSEIKVENLSPEGAELRELKAHKLIRNYSLGAFMVGLIPIPILDLVLVVALQVRMLQKLGEHYGQPFQSRQRIQSVLASLLAGAALPYLLMPILFSLVKLIPVVGTIPAIITMPLLLSGTSYAIGRTFMQHYESGGTLLSFDPARMRAVFQAYYKKGQKAQDEPEANASQPSASA